MVVDAPEAPTGAIAPQLRDQLQRQGALFVKLGHYLATRPDLVDDADIDALTALPDTAAPLSFDIVRAMLARSWHGPVESKLGGLSATPFAARILDQLHAGTAIDGTAVLVRVIRPDAAALLRLIDDKQDALERLVRQCCPAARIAPRAVVADFRTWLADQIDLSLEGDRRSREARAHGLAADSLAALCTTEVVVSRAGPRRADFDDAVARPVASAGAMVRLLFDQVFKRHRAHDVPLESNMAAAPGAAAGWIADGPDRPLTAIEVADIRALWMGLHAHDEASVLRAIDRSVEGCEKPAREQLEREVLSSMRRNVAARPGTKPVAGRGHAADDILLDILRATRAAGGTMASGPLSAHRMLIIGYRTARRLFAGSEPEKSGLRCLARLHIEEGLETLDADLGKIVVDLLLLLRDAPERLNQITADLADGTLGVVLTLDETAGAAEAWNRRVRLIATAIVSLGPFFLLGYVGRLEVLGIPLFAVLGLVLAALFAWMALQWRALR